MKIDSPASMSDGKTEGKGQQTNSLTLVLLYAALAGMWILFSDQALIWLINDPADFAMVSTFKGLFFVAVTTLLLYGLMRRFEVGAAALPLGYGLGWPVLLMAVLVAGICTLIIQRSLAHGESLAVAAWIGMAGLLILIVLGAALLILRQQTQLQLAQATRNAQDERLRALKLLAAIADSSEDAIFALDLEGRFVMANRVVLADTGKTLDEMLGKDESSLFPPLVAAAVMADNQWVLTHGVSRTIEEALPLAGGKQTLLTTKSPLRDESGKAIGLLGISRDITARKAAEAALQRLSDDLASTLRAIPDLLFELDEAGRYLKVEATAHNLLAAPAEQLLGHTVGEMLPPEAAATVMDALANAARNGTDYGRTFALPLEAGLHHFELSVARKSADFGSGQRFIMLSRDITARKAAEDELRCNNEELQRFNRATVGRELEMVELKKQVNALSRELGRYPTYPLDFLEPEPRGGKS